LDIRLAGADGVHLRVNKQVLLAESKALGLGFFLFDVTVSTKLTTDNCNFRHLVCVFVDNCDIYCTALGHCSAKLGRYIVLALKRYTVCGGSVGLGEVDQISKSAWNDSRWLTFSLRDIRFWIRIDSAPHVYANRSITASFGSRIY
jgi:hypothetical protein